MNATSNWMSAEDASKWIPVANDIEQKYGIPENLLARLLYQESHYRADIISGVTKSSAGAVGIAQLLPRFFPGAGADPAQDIDTAGNYLSHLFNRFHDWQIALAAYNWGPGNVMKALVANPPTMLIAALPQETRNYVTQICSDVPESGSIIPGAYA